MCSQDLAAHRQSLLNERNTLQQFFRDIADEESWIKEKKLLVTSDDYGRDLTGVQNLRKKHKRFESELASHEPAIQVGEWKKYQHSFKNYQIITLTQKIQRELHNFFLVPDFQ